MPEITQILHSLERGNVQAADELLPLVYEELRKLAAHKMSLQPPGQTLQATALVHEAYLPLVSNEEQRWQGRRHFFSAAAEAMRHILIDRARRRARIRHGQRAEHVPMDEVEIAAPASEEILLQLNDALEEAEADFPRTSGDREAPVLCGIYRTGDCRNPQPFRALRATPMELCESVALRSNCGQASVLKLLAGSPCKRRKELLKHEPDS